MKVRRRSGSLPAQSVDTDLASALEAMNAPELRAFVRAVLDELEDEHRARVVDSLMARAVKGDAAGSRIVRLLELSVTPGRSRARRETLGTPTPAM